MITTRKDLKKYLALDRTVNKNLGGGKCKRIFILHFNKLYRFHTLLRYYEYHSNSFGKGGIKRVLHIIPLLWYYYHFKTLSYKLGFTIHKNCFGPGLNIRHYGSIVVNPKVKIGKNCVIHSGVNIGEVNGKAPVIGDNVYIGPGAKIFGGIRIGNNVKIGANAVVFKDCPEDNVTLVGVPARKVEKKNEQER